ncbi:unnamed protein product [Urochloa humidicola]
MDLYVLRKKTASPPLRGTPLSVHETDDSLTFSTIEHSKETRRVEQRIRLRESSLLFLNQPIRIRFSGERGHCLLKISIVTCFYMVKSRSIIGSACQASMY